MIHPFVFKDTVLFHFSAFYERHFIFAESFSRSPRLTKWTFELSVFTPNKFNSIKLNSDAIAKSTVIQALELT